MGALCSKSDSAASRGGAAESSGGGTHKAMFDRIDKGKKGYIDLKNLQDLMRDDKTYFQGKDANHILNKYGSDGKMTFDQFKEWWGSTYTTYNEDHLTRLVDEVNAENASNKLDIIRELPEETSASNLTAPHNSTDAPHNSNVAVSRS